MSEDATNIDVVKQDDTVIEKLEEVKQEEPPTDTIEEVKPVAKPRAKPKGRKEKIEMRPLTSKATCPDCNRTISVHNLKYSHAAICPAKKAQFQIIREPIQAQQLEERAKPSQGEPTIIYKERELNEDDERQIYRNYVIKMRAKMEDEKKQKYKQLFNSCISSSRK